MTRARIFFVAIATLALAAPAFALSGAIFTTNSTCQRIDQNIYVYREDVYLNGGPQGNKNLDPGFYWVKVTEPDGTLLGVSDSANFEILSDGKPADCSYDLWSHLQKASDNSTGYDLTTNPGLEYKVTISTVPDFKESDSKSDNFKVHNPHIQVTQECAPGDVFVGDTITVSITVTNT